MGKIITNSIVSAVIAILAGLLLVCAPDFISNGLVEIIGVLFIIAGIYSCVNFFKSKSGSDLLGAIIGIIGGLLIFIFSKTLLGIVFILMGVLLIFMGGEQIVALCKGKASWKGFIVPAAIIVCGIFFFFHPAKSVKTLVIILGIALIIYGVYEFFIGCKTKKANR